MISCGYIIMIIVDSCIIWFHLDCIMQLKKSYYMYIATNVSSRKSATTFGDLPDWLVSMILAVSMQNLFMHTCGMMTSSNGNIFRVTGPFCWEFTGHLWIPLTKASDAELWYFLWSAPWKKSGWVNNDEAGDLRRHRAHYDVTVMVKKIDARFNGLEILATNYTALFFPLCDITMLQT